MKKITSICLGLLVIVGLVALTAGQGAAEVLASASRTTAYTRNAPIADDNVLLPLNNSGTTSLVFYTNLPNQKVIISYSAECSVRSTNNDYVTYVDMDIAVDGVVASPSNDGGNAFCTGHGNNTRANWTSVVTIVHYIVRNPGLHRVWVRANGLNMTGAGEGYRIDDSTTVVWK